jgi:DNA-binding CsgD family transcriptional regulator
MLELPGTSAAELSLMLDVVDRHRCGEPGQHVPHSLLRDLAKLVPFDDATFQVMDPYRHLISIQSVESPAAGDDSETVDLWWPAFWEHCSYPQRSGDFATVWRGSDAMPGTSAGPHWAAYLEASPESAAHNVVVSLPPSGAVDRRLILWRESDPDFSERDIHLLALLRPHLVEVYNHHQDALSGTPELTARQWEILRLVSEGFTNGQIARRLSLSEATVRKHLENTYSRLGVTNRTSAVSRARRRLHAS